jgi:hypothetical protein
MIHSSSRLSQERRFGAYSVLLRGVEDLNGALRDALGLTNSDAYLEVHVPESVEGTPRAVLGAFKQGAIELADFLVTSGLTPARLIGVTHQNVATPARRFLNFNVLSGIPEDAVDPEKTDRIERGYRATKRAKSGIGRGPLCFCYQSFESFLRFTEALRNQGQATAPAGG